MISKNYLDLSKKVILHFLYDIRLALKEIDPDVLSNPVPRREIERRLQLFLEPEINEKDILLVYGMHQKPSLRESAFLLYKEAVAFIGKHKCLLVEKLKYNAYVSYDGSINGRFRLGLSRLILIVLKNPFTANALNVVSKLDKIALNSLEASEEKVIYNLIDAISSASDQQLCSLTEIIFSKNISRINRAVTNVLDFNSISGPKCLVLSTLFATTWAPTFDALNQHGWKIGYILQHELYNSKGYGCMNSEEIPDGKIYYHNYLSAMIFFALADNYPLLFCGEVYHGVNWHAGNNVIMNLTLSCMANAIKNTRNSNYKNLYLFMYDGLKPLSIFCKELKNDNSKFFERFMKTGDKIIYNSNGESFGQYVENAYGITAPRLHFMRYSAKPRSLKPKFGFGKNNDEFHVVSITNCLDRQCCEARAVTHHMVLMMLEQGINFHYYTGDSKETLEWFIKKIKPGYAKYFHVYPINRDQKSLVSELHQYHAGFNGSDNLVFSEGMVNLTDRKYQDGMLMYMQSTYATSFLVYAAAGVPIITPSFTHESNKYFGDFCIPMNYSEFSNAKKFFTKINLQKICSNYSDHQYKGWVDTYIDMLIEFLSDDYKQNKCFTGNNQKVNTLELV